MLPTGGLPGLPAFKCSSRSNLSKSSSNRLEETIADVQNEEEVLWLIFVCTRCFFIGAFRYTFVILLK